MPDIQKQVDVGTIISSGMDAAMKKILQDLANAAAGSLPLAQSSSFSSLDAQHLDKLSSVPSDELAAFLEQYSNVQYGLNFLPKFPALVVTIPNDRAVIAAQPLENPGILGFSGSIGITGTISF